jgi:hypothetical protein
MCINLLQRQVIKISATCIKCKIVINVLYMSTNLCERCKEHVSIFMSSFENNYSCKIAD